jgi:PhzF family phenazine biosynthesis protein
MLQIFQINTFTLDLFSGNPAIVCPLQRWLDTELMRRIAAESRRTCAFFVGADGHYELRWFTPRTEIEGICGHGTLAAAFVILNELGDKSEEIVFHVPAGDLRVSRSNRHYILDLPSLSPTACPLPERITEVFGREPEALLGALDLIAVFSADQHVADFKPDLESLKDLPLRAVIVTAPGGDVDFVSRWFAPKQGEGEDTGITGSAHCSLVPYWANRLGKTRLRARQLSPRGGIVDCELNGDRVLLLCTALKYMQGYLYL